MKVYVVSFNGIWLVGYLIVFAVDLDDARAKAVKRLESDNLSTEDLRIGEIDPEQSHAWLIWNGDY